ncbi:threonine/serine exporter family protein [Anaerococcus sp. AGMB00486]|uniref:Threonine/serine exporter family protein n=2 Tax=Anaerococcus TaxID=165779 RepID=A0ABX2N8D1_9FIRM|nr:MULTISPECIES: threonine/serine exporter family protein [Anaerococcus]MDY3006410.1 threonine/serine exporter family protein [Anaerococcus porci]MSS77268.1 threonine/serine exporter [Anaerococcus porci]NVF10929.1 threonine/serine exporter family protein [Anaerococcus faecalis]
MHLFLGFIFSYISSVGFAMLFSSPKRAIKFSALAGAIGFLIYNIAGDLIGGVFLPILLGAYVTGILGEIFARVFHMPAILFIIPGIINLVPGKGIYNTLFYFVDNQKSLAFTNLFETLVTASAISFGILLASSISKSLMGFKFRKPSKKYDWRKKK